MLRRNLNGRRSVFWLGSSLLALLFVANAAEASSVNLGAAANYTVLGKMSQLSHANSYRATNRRELQAIYNHIDRLEKTEVKIRRNATYHPLFQWPLLAACGLLAVEIVLAHTRYRRVP